MNKSKNALVVFIEEKSVFQKWKLICATKGISFSALCRDAANAFEKELSSGLNTIEPLPNRFVGQSNLPVGKLNKEAARVTVVLSVEDHARFKKFTAAKDIGLGFFIRHAVHRFTSSELSEMPRLESNLAVVEKMSDSKSKSGEFISSNLSGQKQLNWTDMASRVIFCLYAEMTNRKGLTWTWKDFRQLLSSHPEVIGKIIKSTNPALHEEIGSSMLPAVIAVTKYHCQELMSH